MNRQFVGVLLLVLGLVTLVEIAQTEVEGWIVLVVRMGAVMALLYGLNMIINCIRRDIREAELFALKLIKAGLAKEKDGKT